MDPHIISAMIGGTCMQIVLIIEAYKSEANRKPNFKSLGYWLTVVAAIAVSGGLGYAFFNPEDHVHKLVCFQVGAGAPSIVKNLAAAAGRLGKV
jgi:hypothetical protein